MSTPAVASRTALQLVGTCDQLALFACAKQAAVLDVTSSSTIETGPLDELISRFNWQPTYPGLLAPSVHQQALAVLDQDVQILLKQHGRKTEMEPVLSGGARTYSIPKQVQATAQRALAAATAPEATAQADPIAVATARSLAAGTPVTLPKLRQIARALSIRHTVTPTGAETAAQDATGAVYLLWGGNAARRWANGVINREDARARAQFASQPALRAAAGDNDTESARANASETNSTSSADSDSVNEIEDDLDLSDDPTDEEFRKALFSGEAVPDEWFQQFYDETAEGPHTFAPSQDRPNLCLYCGAPFYFDIHDVSNRWISDPDSAHFFSESDDDSNVCAICQKPPTDKLHQVDLSAGGADAETVAAPEALAAYTPYHQVETPAGVLAALMQAEQRLDSMKYFAAVEPHDPEMATAVFRVDGDTWQRWDTGFWAETTEPTAPLQLLDDQTAFSLVRFGLPTSIPSFDLDERALFEAAREELSLDDIDMVGESDSDGDVSYQVHLDTFEPNTALGLSALLGDTTYVWDYGTGSWEPSKFGIPEGTNVAEAPFEIAASVAAQLLDHGSADLTYSGDDLLADIASLESTEFFDLLAQTLLPATDDDDYWDDGGEDDDYWDDDEEVDWSDDERPPTFFMLQDPTDASRALSLHANPDGNAWHVWDPEAVSWRSEQAPDTERLIPANTLQATQFAAWQYMSAHGIDTLATTAAAAGEQLAATLATTEFIAGYGPILVHRAPRRAQVRHAEPIIAAPAPDQLYTPEERSKNATKQVRDQFGRFAKANSRVMLKSGQTGHISKIDPERQTVEVVDDDGNVHDVPANSVTIIDEDPADPDAQPAIPELDLNKIAAQPRAGARTTKASLPYLLPVMDRAAIDKMYADYQTYVEDQRKKASGK